MAARTLSRRQVPAQYKTGGGTEIVNLTLRNLYRELGIKVTGAPTLTAVNNTVANTKRGDEWAVIAKLRIVANSSEVLFEGNGNDLWWLNRTMIGSNPSITPAIGDGATANPAFESTLILPFWSYRAAKPMDSAFNAGSVNNLRLEVTWGNYTDINALATAWTTTPSLEIQSDEVEPSAYKPPFIQRIVKQSQTLSGAQSQFRFNLDVGPAYRGFLINTQDSGTGNDTTGLITNVRLISGGVVLREYSEKMLQQKSTLRGDTPFGIEIDSTGIARQTKCRISAANDPRAWYYMNLTEDGYLSEAVQSGSTNELYLEFTTSAAATINVMSQQLFPNGSAATPQAAAA